MVAHIETRSLSEAELTVWESQTNLPPTDVDPEANREAVGRANAAAIAALGMGSPLG